VSAYVIVEASVLDEESRDRYGSQVGPILRKFGGEVSGVRAVAIALRRAASRMV
jgi:uncharacterized protein (DUF1330 family)